MLSLPLRARNLPVPKILTARERSLLGRPRFLARDFGPRAPRAAARAGKAYPIQGTLRTVGHGHGHASADEFRDTPELS